MEAVAEPTSELCFHGPVRVHSWSDTSAQGFRVKLELLDGRDALAHFEDATRRSKKRAGQRYRAVWQDNEGRALADMPAECWFCGANWSHQSGASIVFTVDDEGALAIRALGITVDSADSVEVVPTLFLGLVQLDDDEKPVNQREAALVEFAEGLVGGPKSKAAAMRCQEAEFQLFVGRRLGIETASVEQCDRYIKTHVGIHTKRLLDYNDPTTGKPFWDKYELHVNRPYLSWLTGRAVSAQPG
jgi:hypothetical protein